MNPLDNISYKRATSSESNEDSKTFKKQHFSDNWYCYDYDIAFMYILYIYMHPIQKI